METILKIKEKNAVAFLLTGDPLLGLTDETIGAVVQFKDISERKIYEDALKRTNKKLEELARIDELTQIANTINNSVHRSYDLAARYGGEEFACILPETNLKGASIIADSVLNAVRNCKIPHEYSTVAEIVTVSMGCFCMIPDGKDEYNVLMTKADNLLYKSKETIRNRITIDKSSSEMIIT